MFGLVFVGEKFKSKCNYHFEARDRSESTVDVKTGDDCRVVNFDGREVTVMDDSIHSYNNWIKLSEKDYKKFRAGRLR